MKETKCLFKMSEAHHQMRMGGLFFLNPPPFFPLDLARDLQIRKESEQDLYDYGMDKIFYHSCIRGYSLTNLIVLTLLNPSYFTLRK